MQVITWASMRGYGIPSGCCYFTNIGPLTNTFRTGEGQKDWATYRNWLWESFKGNDEEVLAEFKALFAPQVKYLVVMGEQDMRHGEILIKALDYLVRAKKI